MEHKKFNQRGDAYRYVGAHPSWCHEILQGSGFDEVAGLNHLNRSIQDYHNLEAAFGRLLWLPTKFALN